MRLVFSEGTVLTGRFGKHTGGESPDWDEFDDYTIEHVQNLDHGQGQLVVIDGHEFVTAFQLEESFDNPGTFIFNAEETLFEFT